MDIRTELTNLLEDLNKQLAAVKAQWQDYDVFTVRTSQGSFILAPLLEAKAQVLTSLASLPADPMEHHLLSEHYGARA